jgi:hypothetical protein
VSPQEKVAAVKPLWETLQQPERVELLTVPVAALRERVKQLTERAKAQAGAQAQARAAWQGLPAAAWSGAAAHGRRAARNARRAAPSAGPGC